MNFLGHLYLSGNDEEIKVGNFIGDFVKGNPYDRFSGKIAAGIVLHREIDQFTDSHEATQRSRKKLVPKYRHYSGVIIDIFYDHFLAAHWSEFSETRLEHYAGDCYHLMRRYHSILPDDARHMLPFMERYNWLLNYSNLDGVQRTLSGMSRRTKFKSHMEKAVEDLEEHYEDLENDFHDFFPEICEHVKELMNHNE